MLAEPAELHYYQLAFTIVGGGEYDLQNTERAEASLIPPTSALAQRQRGDRSRRTSGRLRPATRQRLHQRARCLRDKPALSALDRGDVYRNFKHPFR